MVHIVKIYFEDSNQEKQIRRLAVNSDVISSFSLLLKKIQDIFQFETNNLVIKWKDQENDFIYMSSDDELAQALANADNGLLKLFVSLKRDGAKSNCDQKKECENSTKKLTGPKHSNIICDGCDKEIFGRRYKCLECVDFDLCSSCNYQNVHSFHDMIQLVRPVEVSREWVFQGSRKFWKSLFELEALVSGLIKTNSKIEKVLSSDSSKTESSFKKNTQNDQHFNKKPMFPNHFEGKMKSEAPSTSSSDQTQSQSKDSKHQNFDQDRADPDVVISAFVDCISKYIDVSKFIDMEIIDDISKYWKDIKVNQSGKEANQESKREEVKQPATQEEEVERETEPSLIISDLSFNKIGTQKDENQQPNLNEASTSKFNMDTINLTSEDNSKLPEEIVGLFVKNSEGAQKVEVMQTNINEAGTSKSNTDANMILGGNSKFIEEVSGMNAKFPATDTISEDPMGWTLLDAADKRIECGAGKVTHDAKHVDPENIVGDPKTVETSEIEGNKESLDNIQTTDPVILSALHTMKSMGFTNEGGWLESLLISKHGNINEALDALYRR